MTTRFFAPVHSTAPRMPQPLYNFLLLSLFLILPFFSHTALAQNVKNNWDAVMKVASGSKLAIKTKTRQKFGGKVTAVTADSITLSTGKTPGKDVELKREEIAEIRKKSGARMAGYAAMLGGLGLAGGYGIGYGVGEATDAGFAIERPMAAFGAAVGAVIGLIIGSRGAVIYKAA